MNIHVTHHLEMGQLYTLILAGFGCAVLASLISRGAAYLGWWISSRQAKRWRSRLDEINEGRYDKKWGG